MWCSLSSLLHPFHSSEAKNIKLKLLKRDIKLVFISFDSRMIDELLYIQYILYFLFNEMSNESNVKWTVCHFIKLFLWLFTCICFSSIFPSTSAGSKAHLLLFFHQHYVVALCPCVCLRCECVFTSAHRNLEVGCPLSKTTCSWQWVICRALSPDYPLYNYSCIPDTPSGKRTSSFVFQVGSTMDVTYLTRSIHASFKDSIGMVGGRGVLRCWFSVI